MATQFTTYTLVYLAAGLTAILASFIAWKKRPAPGGKWLLWMGLAAIIWTLACALDSLFVEQALKIWWGKVSYLGSATISVFLLLFALEYTRQARESRKTIALLFVVPALGVGAAFSNDLHHLLWSGFAAAPGLDNVLIYQHGPLYWGFVAYMSATVLAATLFLIRYALRSRDLFRFQALVLIAAALIPWLGALVYNFAPGLLPGLEIPAVATTLSTLIFTLNLVRWKLLDLLPVAQQALLEGLQDGVIVLDAQERVVDLNRAGRDLLGDPGPAAIGQPIARLYPEVAAQLAAQPGPGRREFELGRPPARQLEMRLSGLSLRPGLAGGSLVVLREITAQKRIARELQESESLFRSLFEHSPNAIHIADLETMRILDCNQNACQLSGHTRAELIGQSMAILYTDEYNDLLADPLARQAMIEDIRGQTNNTREIMRRAKDGGVFMVESSRSIISVHGRSVLMSIDRDISERKVLEAATRSSREKYRGVVEFQSDPVCRWLVDTTLIFVNEAFCEYFGRTQDELMGSPLLALLPAEAQASLQKDIESLLKGEVSTITIDELNYDLQGQPRWAIWACQPVENEAGLITAIQCSARDISDRKRAEDALQKANTQLAARLEEIQALQAQLSEQVIRDVLTGLYNRRFLQETLEREIIRSMRGQFPLSLVMIDIDYFKKLNDTQGHKAGDLVLQAIGDTLHMQTRQMDVACRFGGEEFIIVMPTAPHEAAMHRAEELRQAVEALRVPYKGEVLQVTVSVGVASFPVHGSDSDALLHAVDHALYAAKQAGRNVVRAAEQA